MCICLSTHFILSCSWGCCNYSPRLNNCLLIAWPLNLLDYFGRKPLSAPVLWWSQYNHIWFFLSATSQWEQMRLYWMNAVMSVGMIEKNLVKFLAALSVLEAMLIDVGTFKYLYVVLYSMKINSNRRFLHRRSTLHTNQCTTRRAVATSKKERHSRHPPLWVTSKLWQVKCSISGIRIHLPKHAVL